MNGVLRFLKKHFFIPAKMNWGYPLLILAVSTGILYLFRCIINDMHLSVPATSLLGYSALIPVITVVCLIFPAILLSKGNSSRILGEYTGAGSLAMAFLSGIPIILIRTSFHNLISWAWLRMGFQMVFPAYFYLGGTDSVQGQILAIMSETVIPAFGASFFFFGFMWTRFRSSERRIGYYIAGIFFALFCLDAIDFLPLCITGVWCGYLRTKTGNIAGPMLCLICSGISGMLLTPVLEKVDITSVMTYSDIPSTFFYSSVPAAFLGIVLLSFFLRMFGEFYYMYFDISHGDTSHAEETAQADRSIPAFVDGVNPALLVAAVIFAVIWIALFKGAHL